MDRQIPAPASFGAVVSENREEHIMTIDVNTRFITLIGMPLGQSFSARMQNAGYASANCNMLYFYTEADTDRLPDVISAVRNLTPFAGAAVTKPNKVEVMRYLDDFDPLCKKMGSSNTIVKTADGRLIGYNTDGYGALRSLKEELGELRGKTAFSFGAGGTARSVCFELANAGVKRIFLCSRSVSCEELSAELNRFYPDVCIPIRAADKDAVAAALGETEIVLNLTGAGMLGKEDATCVDQKYLKPAHVCFDATYNPTETRFLREAREVGCKTINGMDMLLYQGVRQIELWTGGACAPLEAMRRELANIMAEQAR